MIGKTISHYEILEKLGAGGMGDIYKARDSRLNRTVAIKVLASSPEGTGRRRFLQEAQAASALNHPNIITIHDIVSQDDNEFMVMEYVPGKTLADLIPAEGLGLRNTLRYGVQIADALQAAHAAGIVHRDLKPSNVMVTDTGRVKVLDFGLAKFTGRDSSAGLNDATVTNVDAAPLTVQGSIIGTVSYMSPEQAQGKTVDHRSDIFSFGLVLYEMITGRRAFQSDSAISTLTSILRDEVRPIAEVVADAPVELEQVIGRALRKNPEDRWQSTQELQAALESLRQRSDSGTLSVTNVVKPAAAASAAAPGQARAAAKKTPMAVIAALAGMVVVAAAGGGIWWKKHHARPVAVAQESIAPQAQAVAEAPTAAAAVPAPTAGDPAVDGALTNDSIVEMVQAKVSNALIINQIRSSKNRFNLSVAEVIRLSKAGVPDAVIEAMRNPSRAGGGTVRPPSAPASAQPAPQNSVPAQSAAAPQPATPQPAPAQPAPASVVEPVIPVSRPVAVADGLPFIIRLKEDVPNGPQAGQTLHFEAAKDFRIGNSVIVAQGAAVTGEIVDAGKKKLLSKGPKPSFRLVQATAVDGSKLNLRATPAPHPDGKAERSLEVPGRPSPKDLAAAAGSEYVAYTEGAQTVSVKQ